MATWGACAISSSSIPSGPVVMVGINGGTGAVREGVHGSGPVGATTVGAEAARAGGVTSEYGAAAALGNGTVAGGEGGAGGVEGRRYVSASSS